MKKYKIYTSSRYQYTDDKGVALAKVKKLLNEGFDVSVSETDILEK